MKRFTCITDTHGDLEHKPTTRALLEFCKTYKPEVRLHLGDAFDLRALRNGASDEEKAEGVAADIEAGLTFLRAYRPTVFMFGNHDFRAVERATHCADGMLREHCRLLLDKIMDEFAAMGTKVYPYDMERGVHRWGGVNWLHGYHANMHAAAMAGRVYGPCFMGHVHTRQVVQIRRLGGGEAVTLPCGMDIKRADYARRRLATLAWCNGFAWGEGDDDSLVYNIATPRPDGRYLLPTHFAEMK